MANDKSNKYCDCHHHLYFFFQFCTSSPIVSETTSVTHNTAEHHEKMSTASSISSAELDHHGGRKVVWPCINNHQSHQQQMSSSKNIHLQKNNINSTNGGASVDKPMAWMKHANGGEFPRDANEEMDMDIQRTSMAAVHSNRLSRSRSRHIMDRARSFERAAAEAAAGGTTNAMASGYNSNASSRPVSRAGSVARNRRSPSVGRQLGRFDILHQFRFNFNSE